MPSILIEAIIIILLILLNGVFAMAEIAVVSARRARLEQAARAGSAGATVALEMADSPNRFLSTVQVGITLVVILSGAFGGATIAQELALLLEGIPFVGQYASAVSFAIVVGAITYLSVVIGELVPKRIALQRADQIAALVARPMRTLSVIATPIVRLLSLSTDAVLKLFGVEASAEQAVTEEEIELMVEQAAQEGMIEQAERSMIERVFRLNDRPLRTMMTPRPDVVWLDISGDEDEVRVKVSESNHSRFPVCDGDLDHVLGVVQAKDLLTACYSGMPYDLRELMREPLFVPETMRALHALERFRESGLQIALLVDEYGGIEGVVTLINILEAIVGDIPTVEEISEPPIVQREDGSWLAEGLVAVADFKEYFEISTMPGEGKYQTLGGFMVYMLGDVPGTGDHFGWGRMRFEVVDMDGYRVDKVLVEAAPEADITIAPDAAAAEPRPVTPPTTGPAGREEAAQEAREAKADEIETFRDKDNEI